MSTEYTNNQVTDLITKKYEFKDTINNNPYYFNIRLLSSDGRLQQLEIGSINSLIIEESFVNFYKRIYCYKQCIRRR